VQLVQQLQHQGQVQGQWATVLEHLRNRAVGFPLCPYAYAHAHTHMIHSSNHMSTVGFDFRHTVRVKDCGGIGRERLI
jgi:hypothetical protein